VSGQDKVRIKPFCLGDITFDIILSNMKFSTHFKF